GWWFSRARASPARVWGRRRLIGGPGVGCSAGFSDMAASSRKARTSETPETPQSRAARVRRLLAWYDRHRRKLPWRAHPGQTADPYRVWLSEIMLQQTTVAAVGPYYVAFLKRWPTVEALAAAPVEEGMTPS